MLAKVKRVLVHRSRAHPDTSRRNLAEALLTILALKDNLLKRMLNETFLKRHELGSESLVSILMHSIEYVFMFSLSNVRRPRNLLYDSYSYHDWMNVVEELFCQPQYLKFLIFNLQHRNVQAYHLQRYVAAYSLMVRIQKLTGKSIFVVDCGCGPNIAIQNMRNGRVISELHDYTPDNSIFRIQDTKINLQGVGLDTAWPENSHDLKWLVACSSYPKDYQLVNTNFRNYTKQMKVCTDKHFSGSEGDICHMDKLWAKYRLPKVDMVMMTTVYYQLTADQKVMALQAVERILSPNGMVVLTDFIESIRDGRPILTSSWYKKDNRKYQTLVSFKTKQGKLSCFYSYLSYTTTRCAEVYPGWDYDLIHKKIHRMFTNPQYSSL